MRLCINTLIHAARCGLPVAFGISILMSATAAHAWSYTITDLGPLDGHNRSEAYGISSNGQVAGLSLNFGIDGLPPRAFLYSNGAMTDLGTLGGDSFGYGINNAGEVVGRSEINSQRSAAFLYSNGVMTDLNTLIDPASGWILGEARGINDAGQIVGFGLASGGVHAFLLTPVPEPETYAMLLAGLAVIGVAVRRQGGRAINSHKT